MKHYSIIALASIAAISLLFSCSKEKDVIVPDTVQEQITISASFPEDGLTKVGFIEEGYNNKLNLVWQEGDQITITDESDPSNTQTFAIASGVGEKSATFTGTPLAAAASYKVVYDGNPSYAEQTQAADGDTGHLKYVATLTGVTDYSSFTFTAAASSAVLRLRTSIPDDLYGNIKAVDIKMGTVSVKVNVTNSADAGEENVFTVYASLPGQTEISAGTDLLVSFQMDAVKAYDKYTAYRLLPAMTVEAGKVNTLSLNCSGIKTSAGNADDGTAAHPYLIADQHQMQAMYGLLVAGEKKYFKMVDDVDMTDVDGWTPLNNADTFEKQIDFDGGSKTISNFSCAPASYTSFFGVLYGKCYDVTFVNASITSGTKGCGILGGYGGTAGKPCEVENVHVQGTVTSTAGNCVGGMFGVGREATITRCSANVVISCVGQQSGGIIGVDAGAGVSISDCWTSGSISCDASIIGGIAGELVCANSSITNCFSTMSLATQFYVAGIVGKANGNAKGSKANNAAATVRNHIENCIAWNTMIKGTVSDGKEHYSNGAIVGSTGQKNYLKNCWRKDDLNYLDCPKNAELGGYAPVDQEDADPDHPLVWGSGTYSCGYHGKAAAAGKTLSQVAQEIGWSDAIWDFSDNLPKLK